MNSKRKGTAGENELVNLLQTFGHRAYRNDQIFRGGKNNPDVEAEIFGIKVHFEVKRQEKLNVLAAIQQAEQDAAPDHFPAVAHRKNRAEWLLTVPLVRFLELIDQISARTPEAAKSPILTEREDTTA